MDYTDNLELAKMKIERAQSPFAAVAQDEKHYKTANLKQAIEHLEKEIEKINSEVSQ